MLILVLTMLVVVVKYNRLDRLLFIFLSLIAAILTMDEVSILFSNLKRIKQTEQLQMFWCSMLFQVVFVPVATIGFINIYRNVALRVSKVVASACVILLITGAEYAADWAGVWKHERWAIWQALLLWSSFIAVCVAAQFVFVKYLPREAKQR